MHKKYGILKLLVLFTSISFCRFVFSSENENIC